MANRYWVGGTGTWNTSSTTNWSASSNGPSGASVPTSADSVFFDQAATYTVTMTSVLNCLDITVSAGTVTFATGTGPTLAIYGSMSLLVGTVWSSTGAITFSSTSTGKTVTTNGVSFACSFTFNGVGGGWTLGSALTTTNGIAVTAGTFDTGSYALSCQNLSSSNSNTRSIILGNSTVTLTQNGGVLLATTVTNLTFNAGTSTINCTSTGTNSFNSGGLTFYNVNFSGATTTVQGNNTFNDVALNSTPPAVITITGANTFNTLSIIGRNTTGVNRVTFSNNQTISTLTLNAGTASAYRTMLLSDTVGTQRTLTVTALTAGAADYDFRDIAITGAAAPLTGTRFGDCKGNSGITFPAAKTVYYRQTGSAGYGATGTGSWSLTNGGAADATAFPLPQDTAVFPAGTYPASGSTTTISSGFNVGNIDMSLRTANTMTLSTTTGNLTIYGNWINGTGITLSGTTILSFTGRGSQTITSAGKTFTQRFNIETPDGSVTLQDALTCTNSIGFEINNGTFSAASYAVTFTTAKLSIDGNTARTLDFGSGTWTLSSSGGVFDYSGSNLTVTGSGTITLTSASAKTFAGGGVQTYPILNQGGTGKLTITGNNKFISLSDSSTGSVFLTSGTTTEVSSLNLNGSAGSLLTLGSTGTGNAVLRSEDPIIVGRNSVNAGNVSGVFFIPGQSDYLSIANISATYPLKVTNLTFPSGITLS